MMEVRAFHESWPLRDSFAISRGSKSDVNVVVVEIEHQSAIGRGEAVPYAHYDQNIDDTLKSIQHIVDTLGSNLTRESLRENFSANAARNALDCALWDLSAKIRNEPVWKIAGLSQPKPLLGACSLSLEAPSKLAKTASNWSNYPLLKLKLGHEDVIESIQSARTACPSSRIIVDANEAWTPEQFMRFIPAMEMLGVEMIEQPFPAGEDQALAAIECSILICADESFHAAADLAQLSHRYDVFNIKLDKTGGLTEAIELAQKIQLAGKKLMIGSMMATSLSLAPALLLAQDATYVDLDSSIWLQQDREHGLKFEDGLLWPANRKLWG